MVIERSEPNLSHLHGPRAASLEWRMGSLVLDPIARILIHDGTPLPLGERAVSILLMLVERSGQLVSKEDLIAFAWQGLAVEDSNLTVQVAALRRALALVPGGRSWIETLPRRGYRFVGTAVRSGDKDPPTPDEPRAARSSYELAKLPSSKLVDDQKDLPTVSALTDSRAHHMVGRAAPLDMLDRMAQRILSRPKTDCVCHRGGRNRKDGLYPDGGGPTVRNRASIYCAVAAPRGSATDEAFLPIDRRASDTLSQHGWSRTADSNSYPRANLDAADTRLD